VARPDNRYTAGRGLRNGRSSGTRSSCFTGNRAPGNRAPGNRAPGNRAPGQPGRRLWTHLPGGQQSWCRRAAVVRWPRSGPADWSRQRGREARGILEQSV